MGTRARAAGLREDVVRLVEAARPPVTPVEQLAVATLTRDGTMSFKRLVEQVALDLYREMLRSGGWAVDIGIFGTNLFVPDVARELEAGDGTLWRLETPERGH